MTYPSNSTTTVAILGTDTLSEDILARLLGREGYTTRIVEASPTATRSTSALLREGSSCGTHQSERTASILIE